MRHAAPSALAFHLVFLRNKHFQPEARGADGLLVTMLSEAELAVGSSLESCLARLFTNVIFREVYPYLTCMSSATLEEVAAV